ncbi:FAD-dependent monooxygenase [Microbulbifer sp. MLAF003]|uniref:FAD-dependent oxidoreductase n=1 Tax=unclassified Microbulbifer TaxID=2619833 RepID=UPI0024AD168C|nr:FAD-dependent monooxygenase [Microbulbifer sp. MLAF003]WHI49423.1 FAD-dependent monooxygenase [Microbulbifer sp. MLAF003]
MPELYEGINCRCRSNGLTLAVELALRHILARIIDKRDSSSTLSRAVGITSRSLELLSPLGVSRQLIEEGIAIQEARIYQGTRLVMRMPLHSCSSYFPTILGLPKDRIEMVPSATLSAMGVQVEYQLELLQFNKEGNQVVAELSNGENETFDYIVGAGGIHSAVRECANIAYPGFDLKEKWSIADVEVENWPYSKTFTLTQMKPGLVAVSVPIGENRFRFVSSCENALEAFPLPLKIHKVRSEGVFKVSVRQAESYSKGRIHLVGDAAHCCIPVGGRGMNLGIADAVELAKRMAGNQMDGYSEVR